MVHWRGPSEPRGGRGAALILAADDDPGLALRGTNDALRPASPLPADRAELLHLASRAGPGVAEHVRRAPVG